MLKHAYRLILSCGLILWTMMAAQADVRIVITDGVDSAKPIAVVPFSWNGTGLPPQDVSQIVANDLRNSGKFSPIDTHTMPQTPQSAAVVDAKAWSKIGIDTVVVGTVQQLADGRYQVNYQLVDTVNNPGSVLAQDQFVVEKRWLRYAAHTASDQIFEKLTGIKGAFRTRIAYVVKTNRKPMSFELRIADYDGYDQMTLLKSSEPLMSPAWSPNGKQLAYVTFEGGRSALKIKNLESGAVETIAAYPQHNGAPAFSPDGRKLAFALSKDGSLNLYVMDLTTRAMRKITSGRSNDTEPVWMPDNQTLIYTSDQTGRPQLYSININGGSPERLTWEGRQNQNPSVSPTGDFMVLITSHANGQNVARYDFATHSSQILTSTFLDETPSISPNGTMIIYSSTQGLGSILNLVSSDGRFKAKLPATDGQVRSPAWSPVL